MTPENQLLMANFKAKRKAEQLALRPLAKLLGVSFSSLSRLENQESDPTPRVRETLVAWVNNEPIPIRWPSATILETAYQRIRRDIATAVLSMVIDKSHPQTTLENDCQYAIDIADILMQKLGYEVAK